MYWIFKKIFLEYSCLQCCASFCCIAKGISIYPLFFGFPSPLGHHRALSSVPCALQQVLTSYLFYT